MSFPHPSHTDFHAGSGGACYPNATGYQPQQPYTYAAFDQPPATSYPQPPSPTLEQVPYAVPVDAASMANPPTHAGVDYSRPQTWRNLPQQQERRGSHLDQAERPPSFKAEEPTQRPGRSSSGASLDSTTPSSNYSEVAMAANASVAAAVAPGANYADETSSVSSMTSSATRSSVDAAVDTMWGARRAREKAEAEADQKLLEAVCKASLAEFNDRERAMKAYESGTSQRSLEHKTSSLALQQARSEAEQRKRAAMQTVIDSKTRARQMSEKAREATSLYEQKNSERLAKQAELEALQLRGAQEAELLAVQKRKEEAMRRRTEAEQKAREAREKAEAMRHQAFQAASKVRANSRRQIETQLGVEEDQRQREMQFKLDEIKRNKELAGQRKEAAAKKAEEARRRAEELRARAEQARAGLKSSDAATPTTSA